MKQNKKENKPIYLLGDLIAALFEETSKITSLPVEQSVIVHAALKDLLNGTVSRKHPIAFQYPD